MKRWIKVVGIVAVVILVLIGTVSVWAYRKVAGSLPILEGEIQLAGLMAEVSVERDALGVPTIRAQNREDLAQALGFLHAQDRFFQMDLMRRQAAGELAEIVGPAMLQADRGARLHRFRWRAQVALEELSETESQVLTAYTDGVNQGLAALSEKPFEYVLLDSDPEPWRREDSFLVVSAMFFTLEDAKARGESSIGLLHDVLPSDLAAFLSTPGGEWDAPIDGEAFQTGSLPGLEIDWAPEDDSGGGSPDETVLEAAAGSNNWAVAGWRAANGRAILANDMHLPLSVPNTWYRAVLEWPGGDRCRDSHRMVGVTLPGVPFLVVGSNGHVAWGFTNSQGDWTDLVILESDPADPGRYLTPDGPREFEILTETIAVRGADPESLEIRSTLWGPVIDEDHLGRLRALRWIAHDPGGVNFTAIELEHVLTVEEAQSVANRSGLPPQNFVCVDEAGDIGWTIAGRMPHREGFSGEVPMSWADGACRWNGWLELEDYPRIVNPEEGLIWTANARVVGGKMLELIGDGGYALGARAGQIRDGLREVEQPTETDMLALQLDDRALFLDRWRELLLELLTDDAVAGYPDREELRRLVTESWTGRASIDSVGFRMVRAFRNSTFEAVYGWLTEPCTRADENFNVYRMRQWEGPLWELVTQQPEYLLGEGYATWDEALLTVVDETIGYFLDEEDAALEEKTWGARNTTAIRHPLSYGVPMLSGVLDMTAEQLPGAGSMPRVQSPTFGASERLAVSPGHEEDGYFHMPGGQSGHPLSPFYSAGHDAWAKGLQTPLLPGPAETVLMLRPAG